ncbi:unnamed protein product [Vitrella brassicaformis CCMP3155]|uniref:Uncharacterized protein n=2 Tax=Vitrella brassicaformis TaxID=1169539 RepID=A0A0G4GEN6_VITBC|nr:unnamed protein product [Vitrella brassicaformis CCMP3155]|eukprot:CEM27642.1 unnamed protein product [Vitrella brassicaformis CCMP3155]
MMLLGSPRGLRVMTLEEAGDQLIQAEKMAKRTVIYALTAINCLLGLLGLMVLVLASSHINREHLATQETTIKTLQQQIVNKDALIGEAEAANVLLVEQLATAAADLQNKTAAITAFHEQVERLTEDLDNTTEALQQRDEAILALEEQFQATERALARANGLLDKGRGALNRIFWITAGALSLTVCCWAGGVMATWLHEKTREEKETSINRNTLHEKTASAKGGRCNVTPRDLCLRWPARERRGAIVTGLGCTYVGWVM